ncbi:MAG: helix-turn-helix family protein [Polaromonas sp.]|nr:helix-turn-helix family protein [Polaromonas sp.]
MYHYTESGLDNVWLENGYNVKKTPYGKAVSIDDADGLHELLATELANKAGKLKAKEFRFLRTMLCLSQQSFARMHGVTEQAVSLWERTGKIPTAADVMLRMLVLERLNGDGKITEIINRTNTVERLVNQQIVATETNHKWSSKAQAEKPELMAA